MPKSTKRFIISTSNLNAQGFRMLTEGGILEDFEKNPLLLWNHQRPEGTDKNQILPIGHWEDIQVNGDEISGVPVFDDKDEFAMAIFHKVEAGHLRMCSAGAEPLETSENEADLLPEQTKATVTKWRLKEASICDIGANPDALSVALYNKQGKIITLSDASINTVIPTLKPKNKIMATKTKTAGAVAKIALAKKKAADAKKAAIKLADEATKAELADDTEGEELADDTEGEELADDSGEEDKDEVIARLTQELADAKEELRLAQEQLKLADDKEEETKAEKLADKAVALRKITLAQRSQIVKLAKSDYKGTVEYLNSIKSTKSIKEQVELNAETKTGDAARIEKLSAKTWDELFASSGDLNFVKLNAPDVYKAKFKEKFKKEPKNV